ncbi:MAG: amidohydrolase [Actinomycetota bacterium]
MSRRSPAPADTILTSAPVFTMNLAQRWADFVAITGDRIVAVGDTASVKDWIGPSTQVVELNGGLILPAFQDAHAHPLHGGLAQLRCELHEASGRDSYLEIIQRYAQENPDAEWIDGGGWSMDDFTGGTPERSLLDTIVPDRPVFLTNRDGHGAWVNSLALELAGIDDSTPDPSGGRIERDERGEPQGTLHEHAMDAVAALVPEATPEEREEGLRLAQRQLHALGISSWQDAWIVDREFDAYVALEERGELSARVVLSLLWDRDRDESQIDGLMERRRRGDLERVKADTVKIFQDGVVENFTAAMLGPYLDGSGNETSNSGISMVEPDLLNRYVTALDAQGFQVHIHAIGDRAVRESLDAFEAAQVRNGRRDARHHIAHIQVVDGNDVPRFRTLGVVANAQPLWASLEPQMENLTIPFLAPERARQQYPFASLRRAGATIAFGSDWPVSSPDPLLEMEVAITRVDPANRDGEPLLPEERLDLPAALEAFTMGAAYVNRLERDTGSIEVGKLADIAVLDRDPFEPGAGPLGEAKVVLTLVDGKPVHGDPSIGLD